MMCHDEHRADRVHAAPTDWGRTSYRYDPHVFPRSVSIERNDIVIHDAMTHNCFIRGGRAHRLATTTTAEARESVKAKSVWHSLYSTHSWYSTKMLFTLARCTWRLRETEWRFDLQPPVNYHMYHYDRFQWPQFCMLHLPITKEVGSYIFTAPSLANSTPKCHWILRSTSEKNSSQKKTARVLEREMMKFNLESMAARVPAMLYVYAVNHETG